MPTHRPESSSLMPTPALVALVALVAPTASLLVVTVLVAPTLEQLSEPHAKPVGQQFPPKLAAQELQPLAQLPPVPALSLAVVVAEPVRGTTMVSPALMSVVLAVAGQSVVAQSRPVRQQPPA